MDLDAFVCNALRNQGVSYAKILITFCKTIARAGNTCSTMLVSAAGCRTTATPTLAVFCRRAGRRGLKETGDIS